MRTRTASDDVATASRQDTPRSDGATAAPRWFELLALAGPTLVATVGSFGLLLAVLGVYRSWLALALGVGAAAALLVRFARAGGPLTFDGWRDPRTAAALGAVILAVGYLVFAGSVPSQNVIATRDPGVYLNTARWLSAEGTLGADARGTAFSGVEGLRFESAGVYDMGEGQVEFQFNHLSSVVMSVGHDLGGYRLLFRIPALVTAAGLLAVYAVAVRVVRRPLIALLAPTALAASLPLLYVARNTYSEPFAFVLLWGAVLALADLHRHPRLSRSVLAGVAMGALVSTRVDALLYVTLVFPLAALSIMCSAPPALRRARAAAWATVVGSAAVVATVGMVDLLHWSGRYAGELSSQLGMLRAMLLASLLVSGVVLLLWHRVPALRSVPSGFRRVASVITAPLVVVMLLAGWLVRPLVQVTRQASENEVVENIQRSSGQVIDATRTYAEDSLRWMAWYLGAPALVLAILGLGAVTYLAVRRSRVSPAGLGVLLLTLVAGALYWWKPSITPDHLWASRRYVPAVLPGLAVIATVPVAALTSKLRSRPQLQGALVAVLALAVVVPPAVTTWPVRWQREQYGYLNVVREACDLLPENAAVVILGGYAGATLQQTLRSWCGVPVAAQGSAVDASSVMAVADQIRRNGHQLVLVSADSRDLTTYLDEIGEPPLRTNGAADHWTVRSTLDRPPHEYRPAERALPVQNPFRLHVLVAEHARWQPVEEGAAAGVIGFSGAGS